MKAVSPYETAIHSALHYIGAKQLSGGGFLSDTSPDPSNFAPKKSYRTTFIPSIIACALSQVKHGDATAIMAGVARFLATQPGDNWSFNYWDRTSKEATQRPYPDDLDDTACALAALLHNDKTVFGGADLAKITQLLIAVEAKTGGPYYTWLTHKDADAHWKDVDIAVNANIAYFLKLVGVSLPGLNDYLVTAVHAGTLQSTYYPSTHSTLYFLCRAYDEQQLPGLTQKVKKLRATSPLEAALILSCKSRLGLRDDTLVDYLISTQRRDGSWPASAFCLDPAVDGETYYAGARSLTTALCVEALSLSARQAEPKEHARQVNTHVQATMRHITKTIRLLPNRELRQVSEKRLQQLMNEENAELIVQVPWAVARAAGLTIDERTLEKLARINVWGWLAYTILDDFLDEGGDPKDIPSAVMASRELMNTLHSVLPDAPHFHAHANDILSILDGANAWEVAQCRASVQGGRIAIGALPNYAEYAQLAQRSLGHTIAAIGVVYAGGHTRRSSTMRQLEQFFHHYLIARQLNDDARDWQDDLRYGHINAAATLILEKWPKPVGKTSRLDSIVPKMQEVMWQEVDEIICQLISQHIAKAQQAAAHFASGSLDRLLAPLEKNLQHVIDEHQKTKDFITHF